MQVRVFGTGCPNCRRLEAAARDALEALGMPYELTKVEALADITRAGVLRTPALEVDGHLVLQGRVPGVTEMKHLFAKAAETAHTP